MRGDKHQLVLNVSNKHMQIRNEISVLVLTAWHRWLHGFTDIVVHFVKAKHFLTVFGGRRSFKKYSVTNSSSHWL